MLSIYSYRKYPQDGWVYYDYSGFDPINAIKKYILPPNAYANDIEWIKSLREVYPAKVDKVLDIIRTTDRASDFKKVLLDYATYKFINFLNETFAEEGK